MRFKYISHSITVLLIITSMSFQSQNFIFSFSENASLTRWQTVNDGVMGGVSKSDLSLSENNHGKFTGHVSLANNGGFASVKFMTDVKVNAETQQIVLKLKGDGKTYQFRIKSSQDQSESYVQEFKTNGEWQTIKLDLNNFYPQYRGRKLDKPNFNFSQIEEIRFLIANNKEEDFILLIDSIRLD